MGAGSFRANGATWSAADFYAGPVSASMSPGPTFESANGQGSILGTGLFLSQARKHARLSELIRNGTSIIRTRAQTLGTPPLPSSLPILPASVPQRHPVLATPQASQASNLSSGAYTSKASTPEERNLSSKKPTTTSVPVDFPHSSSSGEGSGSSSGLRD
ncbi:hypothetical protein CVT26_007561 [Gymnopilus dilepis]|uniref:Uncharacterized protein n=1 Tax=Gymnopilus dilepis TaxID=231916 RepID=A0A409XAM8_9AGAR|nr:hypothetical protein CVT26_007561 [Gymnopilus dilepis]